MVKKREKAYASEFPILDQLGLYASATKGDGNCLFRALSDELYGDESHHSEIRSNVVNYVERNGDHFAAFVGEFGETFSQYVSRMRQDGVYGGHIEITGFADRYNKEVVVYQADSLYIIQPRESKNPNGSVHIAYHTWEHYSSVRKTGSPSGPVEIVTPKSSIPLSAEYQDTSTDVATWQIDIVMKSVPDAVESKVIEMLREKDTDTVIEELLMAQYADDPEPTAFEGPEEPKAESQSDKQDNHSAKTNSAELSNVAEKQNMSKTKAPKVKTSASDGLSRKEAARQRRTEKKERIRQKKAKQSSGSTAAPTEEDGSEALSAKIIHI